MRHVPPARDDEGLVRPAGSGDLPALTALPGLSDSTRRHLDVEVARASARPSGTTVALVACVGDEVVGAAFGLVQVDEGHVIDLAVAPLRRRHGVGRRLLRSLVAELRARDARAITLEVRTSNLAALSLYRGEGFEVEGRRPRYYPDGEDALLLWRRGPVADRPAGTVGAEGG